MAAALGLGSLVNLSGSDFLVNSILDPFPKLAALWDMGSEGRGSNLPFQTLNPVSPASPLCLP